MDFYNFILLFLVIYFGSVCTIYLVIYMIHHIKLHFQLQNIQEQTCSICMEKVENIPLKCGHAFHDECVLEWFKINNTCPNCRCVILNLNKGLV